MAGHRPQVSKYPPDGALNDHRDAYPDFRCPLSREEERHAGIDFHRDAIRRLAGAETSIIVMTFDWEWIRLTDGETGYQGSPIAGLFDREPWLSVISDPEDDEETDIAHVFMSNVELTDPRLNEVWEKTATNEAFVLVTTPALDWLAWPIEEHLNLLAFDDATLALVREVERETWTSWGIEEGREASLDLVGVAAYVEGRLAEWERQGVTVANGPQYRCWEGDEIRIHRALPVDLSRTDWFYIVLKGVSAEADVTVHDTGTVDVYPSAEDEALEALLWRDRQHAGELDLAGVSAVLERVAGTLAARPDARQDR